MSVITLPPDLDRWAREQAEHHGLADAAAFVRQVLSRERRRAPDALGRAAEASGGRAPEASGAGATDVATPDARATQTDGERLVRLMATARTNGRTFEQIAEHTRSDR